jgi:GAF domain-containing protein
MARPYDARPGAPVSCSPPASQHKSLQNLSKRAAFFVAAHNDVWVPTSESLFGSISEVVTTVSLALAGASDLELDRVIDAALGAIARHESADRAHVTLFSSDGTFSNTHEWVATGVLSQRDSIVGFSMDSFPWSVQLAKAGRVWHCHDLAELPAGADAERRTLGAFGIRSVLQVPIRDGWRTIGVIGFNHAASPRVWPPLTIDLVRRVGEAIGLALLRRDVNDGLRRARESAEQANLARDRFVSRLSHELHTPLHAILGFAELLDTPELSVADRAKVRQIISSGQELQTLLDGLIASSERDHTPIE